MKVSRAHITLAIVFFAGFILGGASLHLFLRHGPFRGHHPHFTKTMLLDRLSRELNLDEKQIEQVRPVVYELDQQLSDLRKETDPRIKAIIQSSVARAEPFLTESQREELHRIASRFPPQGPPPPPQ